MTAPRNLVLRYDEAQALISILSLVDIGGVRNIQRCRCIRILKDECELFETTRQKMLVDDHAEKDPETGKLVEVGGGVAIKSKTEWDKALKELIKTAPLTIGIVTDADKSWLGFVHEVLTTKLCPKISGEATLCFDNVLDAVNDARGPATTEKEAE